MSKTLKDIVQNSNDLYFIKVEKPSGNNRHNTNSWKYTMVDTRWKDESFKNYKFKTVHLRRGSSFFLAYKTNESNAYFVDPKRAMYRNSVSKYVYNLVDYSVKTNDISITKDEPSFRVTQREMKKNGIDNFLDLCYYYKNYTAIGTGYTRDIRNLVVMDIDVDCTKPDNVERVNSLLYLFAKHDSLPDFYIFNKRSNHIQLQWLIKDLQYKEINQEVISNIINELNNDKEKNKEVDYRKTDFTNISPLGVKYRQYTLALCDIDDKRKFGDKNYTFWKAKNPMAALTQNYDLELLMPYVEDGEVTFRTGEEMNIFFATKEARKEYYDKCPTLTEWYDKLSDVLDPLLVKLTEKKVMKIDDAEDVTDITKEKKPERKMKKVEGSYGRSRNTFVIVCTRYTTWDVAKKHGYRHKEDFDRLSHQAFNDFKKEVFDLVYQKFKDEDEKYGGVWPDTTNKSVFLISEFKKAFNSSFLFAIQNVDVFSYSDDDRRKSLESRKFKKELKLITVDRIKRSNTKINRDELLKEVNRELIKLHVKTISKGSLKRFIAESNNLTDEERINLQTSLNERKILLNTKRR
jgi:hypothetical protein